jgi:hypothetical protein
MVLKVMTANRRIRAVLYLTEDVNCILLVEPLYTSIAIGGLRRLGFSPIQDFLRSL